MALVTAQQLTAWPAEKEEKFVKTMEASSASNKKPSLALAEWADPSRFDEFIAKPCKAKHRLLLRCAVADGGGGYLPAIVPRPYNGRMGSDPADLTNYLKLRPGLPYSALHWPNGQRAPADLTD